MSAAAQMLSSRRECDSLDELEELAERLEAMPPAARDATRAVVESLMDDPVHDRRRAARAQLLLIRFAEAF